MDFKTIKQEAAKICRMVGHYGSEGYINESKTEGELFQALMAASRSIYRENAVLGDQIEELVNAVYWIRQDQAYNTGRDGEGI